MAQLRGLAASAWTALRSAVGASGRDTDNQSASLSERLPLYQQDDNEISGGSASQSERMVPAYAPTMTLARSMPAMPNPITAVLEEEATKELPGRRIRSRLWTPDRGAGFYQTQRERQHSPSLISTGRHAGKSRVQYAGIEGTALGYHVWKRDFFTSVINVKLINAIFFTVMVYVVSFFFWACVWYLLWRVHPECLIGCDGFVSAFVLAVATQQTIGYGDVSPNNCWVANWVIVVQSIFALLLNAIVMGVIFARISRPSQRARTIFLSDSAVVARRDGVLRFMFRCADIRPSNQVINPRIRAFMYSFARRVTAEGEVIPMRTEELEISYSDGLMLLPVTVEHVIDEKSPLYGHTHETLLAIGAEIVAVFEGSSEHGGAFQARQSYLPREIHWGFQFREVVQPAPAGSTQHSVNISQFHEIEPQLGVMELLKPAQLSRKVLAPPRGTVPYPLLKENTLVLSDQMTLLRRRGGRLELSARVGDVYPNQMLDVHVRMYLYRWDGGGGAEDSLESATEPYHMRELDVGHETGADRLCLRLPALVTHHITPDSALAHWNEPGGILQDADSEIVVVVESVGYALNRAALRQRTYSVLSDVKVGFVFAGMVSPPSHNADGKPHISWSKFHQLMPAAGSASGRSTPRGGGSGASGKPPAPPQRSAFAAFACAPAGGGDTSGSGGSSGRPHADDRRPAVMTRQGSAPRANGGRAARANGEPRPDSSPAGGSPTGGSPRYQDQPQQHQQQQQQQQPKRQQPHQQQQRQRQPDEERRRRQRGNAAEHDDARSARTTEDEEADGDEDGGHSGLRSPGGTQRRMASSSELSAATLMRHNVSHEGSSAVTAGSRGPSASVSLGLPIQQREAVAASDSVGVHGTFTQWLDTGLSVAAARNLDRPMHSAHKPRSSGGGTHTPPREGPGYRATVSHMGSRHSSATNLVQMQSADMARYMPTTGPALVGDRAFSDDAATSIPVSHDDWQSTRSLRDVLWPKAGEEQ